MLTCQVHHGFLLIKKQFCVILSLRSRKCLCRNPGKCISRQSISSLSLLKQEEFAETDSRGFIKLTPEGEARAKRIYERHVLLTKLLVNIGVDEKTAAEDACRVEHYISDKTFEAIKAHNLKYGKKD